ncbi:MAG: hypothetical protein ACYCVN_13655 [Acidimicrobiales bacterium]
MMGYEWGCDSLTPVTTPFASAVKSYFDGKQVDLAFWGRYLINNLYPSGNWTNAETAPLQQFDVSKVLPIDVTGNLAPCGNNTTCNTLDQGATDGHAIVQKVVNIVNTGGLAYPTSETALFLDVDPSEGISTGYWQGWTFGVVFQQVDTNQSFNACAYIGSYDPLDAQGELNGQTIADAGGCFGMWTTEPQLPYDYPGDSTVTWGPPNGPTGLAIRFWQFNDGLSGSEGVTVPNAPAPVDFDVCNPYETGPGGTGSVLQYLLYVP